MTDLGGQSINATETEADSRDLSGDEPIPEPEETNDRGEVSL